ncbi:MORN repeat-containing protein [Dysgonomonas termitidis]|uniref:MORN repeat protein n=1 Tax=Dysgonomonas termitidis TaxID=1516126 RepID=A0ABV9KVS6_9BACT
MNSNITNGKLTLPNGGKYEGEIIDGKPVGKGVVKFDDGETFEGTFLNGRPHGWCKRSWADGMYIESVFENGSSGDEGKVYQPGVGLCEGTIYGRGKCRIEYSSCKMPEGSYYEGECLDMKPDGWGKKVLEGWSETEGEWRNGESRGYSVNIESDAFAAQIGAKTGWTGEGIITQGAQRQWWIRTGSDMNNGKPTIIRASDENFDIPQEDLPLSTNAQLFLGFIDMYKKKISGLESQINELATKDQKLVAEFNSQSSNVNHLQDVVTSYDNEILNAEDGSDEEDMASFYGNLSEQNLASSVEELNTLRSQHEQNVSRYNVLNGECDLLENLLTQPIEKKAEAYYEWLVERLNAAKSAEEYSALANKFSDISEHKDCATLADKCKQRVNK